MRASVVSVVAAFFLIGGLAAPDALAQPGGQANDPAAAKVLADGAKATALRAEAEELFAKGSFRDAASRLRAAWALRREAPTLVLLGQCEMKLGRLPEAAQHLAEALGMLGDGPGKERQRVQALFDEVRPQVGGIQIVSNVTGATIIAGNFVGETPIEEVFVIPGEVKVTLKKTGHGEQQRSVRAEAGKTTRVEINLASAGTSVAGPAGYEPVRWSLVPAYVVGGLGLAVLGAGIGLRLAGDGKGSEADDLLTDLKAGGAATPCTGIPGNADTCAQIKGLRSDHDIFVNTSTGLLIGGGVLVAGAVVYGAIANGKNKEIAVLPVGSRTGGGLLVQGSF